jgi:hypothetical protein
VIAGGGADGRASGGGADGRAANGSAGVTDTSGSAGGGGRGGGGRGGGATDVRVGSGRTEKPVREDGVGNAAAAAELGMPRGRCPGGAGVGLLGTAIAGLVSSASLGSFGPDTAPG